MFGISAGGLTDGIGLPARWLEATCVKGILCGISWASDVGGARSGPRRAAVALETVALIPMLCRPPGYMYHGCGLTRQPWLALGRACRLLDLDTRTVGTSPKRALWCSVLSGSYGVGRDGIGSQNLPSGIWLPGGDHICTVRLVERATSDHALLTTMEPIIVPTALARNALDAVGASTASEHRRGRTSGGGGGFPAHHRRYCTPVKASTTRCCQTQRLVRSPWHSMLMSCIDVQPQCFCCRMAMLRCLLCLHV